MDRRPCKALGRQGGPCRSFALPSGLCWHHDPGRAEERRAACAKGGRLRALQGRRRRLERAGQLAPFLSELIQDVLEARVNIDSARTAIYGAAVLRQVVETAELERRVEALEAAAGSGQRWRA